MAPDHVRAVPSWAGHWEDLPRNSNLCRMSQPRPVERLPYRLSVRWRTTRQDVRWNWQRLVYPPLLDRRWRAERRLKQSLPARTSFPCCSRDQRKGSRPGPARGRSQELFRCQERSPGPRRRSPVNRRLNRIVSASFQSLSPAAIASSLSQPESNQLIPDGRSAAAPRQGWPAAVSMLSCPTRNGGGAGVGVPAQSPARSADRSQSRVPS